MSVQLKHLRADAAFAARLDELGIVLPVVDADAAARALAAPVAAGRLAIGNRLCVLPMEGWDGTADGRPTELVERRWERFGASGAKLIWGGEAVAVTPAARANPRQLSIGPHATGDLERLRSRLTAAHVEATGSSDGLVVGLQLTDSGRWSRPEAAFVPRIAYRHPYLDGRVGAGDEHVLTDTMLDDLVGDFVAAAVVAQNAGFDFVDVKHCHGYLLHELLTAYDRPGPYGGDLAGRTRFVQRVVDGIRRDAAGIEVAVRLSAFDLAPHGPDATGTGVCLHDPAAGTYRYAFGGDGTGTGVDLAEVHDFCALLGSLGIHLLSLTAGSPYYCPHAQRPAFFPPSDGYLPPRDPLVEVARLVRVIAEITRAHPDLVTVASGLTYLQEWFARVGGALVAGGDSGLIGFGRGVLSHPRMAIEALHGTPHEQRLLCRTFSDCTTAPRNGLVSGCYPLDPFYKSMPERVQLTAAKRAAEAARGGRKGNRS